MNVLRAILTAIVVAATVLGGLIAGPATPVLAFGLPVSSDASDADLWAAMAKNPINNDLTVAWRADRGALNEVRVASSADGGGSWSPEISIYSGNHGGYLETIRIAYDANGGLHVVFWADQGVNRRVRYRYVPAGADPRALANWRGVNDVCAAGACIEPSLAVDGGGAVYLIYEDTDNRLGVRRLEAPGVWSAERVISTGQRSTGAIAVAPDGRVHVAYALRNARRTFYERYGSFATWQREEVTQISTGDSPFVPEIVADRGGVVHMAWGQDGSICHRQYANGALSGIDCSVGYYEGLQAPSIAVSPSGSVYIAWNRANLAEIWQNARVNGLWGDPERLGADADSGFRTRFQRYGVAFDGEVDLAFIQNSVTRFHQVTPGSRDRQGPTASNLTLAPPPIGSQRAVGGANLTDIAEVGVPTGVKAIQYSLDGINYVTAKTMPTPEVALANEPFDIDLANPGAGGSWTATSVTLRVRGVDAAGNVGPTVTGPTIAVALPPVTTRRYLAEGYTGGTFDEYLTLGNPTGIPIYVSVAFQYAGSSQGQPGTLVEVGPNQRSTVLIDAIAGAGKELSLKLESNSLFSAERPMYFTNYPAPAGLAYNRPRVSALAGVTGGHLGVPAAAPAPTWHFAEGYTGDGFEGYFTIQNPNSVTVFVALSYFLSDGSVQTGSVSVLPNQRRTVIIHLPASPDNPGGLGSGKTFSATLASGTPGTSIIVERVQYFRYTGSMGAVTGGTATLGATALAQTWLFAEGYTGPGFDEYLTIQNPNAAGSATITYYVEGQAFPTIRTIDLPASSRTTVAVHDAGVPGGLGRNKAHATKVETSVPTVVERPMYFVYNGSGSAVGVDGGHNVMGATGLIGPGTSVVLAEGYTGDGFDQYLTFQNPNAAPIDVTITYLKADGSAPVVKNLNLPANQRTTVPTHSSGGAGLGPGLAFSTQVKVNVAAAGGALVERVMYFRYAGAATGGTAAFGFGS